MTVSDELDGVGRSSGARSKEVRKIMEHAIESGECPFCPGRFEATNARAIISMEGVQHWNVWHNLSPLPGTSLHIMLASKTHAEEFEELPDEAILEYHRIISILKEKFGFTSFSTLSRQGEVDFNSATVEHLHAHLIVSNRVLASPEMLPAQHRDILLALFICVLEYGPEGIEPLEWVDEVRESLDVLRAARLGKARPIRVKLSNKVV